MELKVDLKELFENNEEYPEFKDIIVKEKFEKYNQQIRKKKGKLYKLKGLNKNNKSPTA